MQVYSQVGLLERLFYQPSMGLETLQGGGKPRPYHITNRPAQSAIQGGGKPCPYPGPIPIQGGKPRSYPGRIPIQGGQA
jgi:hypothetical protein